MIYLTTGANGTGKTLLTLKDVRELQVKEGRPVAYNGRFDLVAEFGWKKIDAKDWEQEPDGTIFLFDECHKDFPARPGKGDTPGYVAAMGEHRRRGFDIFLITQHPMNIDAFIRRIIGDPGWHRHLKRAGGAQVVSVARWPSVKDQPQKHGASADAGNLSIVPFPKEVYAWYNSATLHTAKARLPFKVKLGIAAAIMVPVLFYLAFRSLHNTFSPPRAQSAEVPTAPAGQASAARTASPGVGAGPSGGPGGKAPMSGPEYVASFRPRVDGLAYTAARYDEVTKPTVAPFPAACVTMGKRCECFSQQATKLQVPVDLCLQIVKNGYFQDWGEQAKRVDLPAARSPALDPNGGNPPAAPIILGLPSRPVQVAQADDAAPYPHRRPASAPH